ncbi:MAG TPA: hypothetical protein VFF14_03670 [Candidatus Deferrimicrobium sp.]|nr:hypothetical protein [Candidatus Deferrimicrobium sp.]
MNIKVRQIYETVVVLIAVFGIFILFIVLEPYIFTSDIAIQLKVIFELSPYILVIGLIVAVLSKRQITG